MYRNNLKRANTIKRHKNLIKIRNKLKQNRNSAIGRIEHNQICKHVKYKVKADLKKL